MKKLLKAITAAAVIGLLAAPVMAATQWSFGGALQYKTFWTERDYGDYSGDDLQGGGAGLNSDGMLHWGTQGDSNISMHMVSDYLEGYIELEYDFDDNKVKTKQYWGKYNFNENFNILIGQTDPLFIQEISRQVAYDNMNLNGIGTANSGTLPMIALGYKGFTVALAKPVNSFSDFRDAYVDTWGADGLTYDENTYFPQLHASYAYEADEWRIKFAGAFASTKIKKMEADLTTLLGGSYSLGGDTLNSWLVGIDGQVFFGPLSLGAAISYGENWEIVGWNEFENSLGYPLIKTNATFTGFEFEDTNTLMLALVAGYQLTERLYFEGGVGYRRDDNDLFDDANNSWTAYLQADYAVAEGFSIIPEIGYMNYGKNVNGSKNKLGYEWYAGAQWRMDF